MDTKARRRQILSLALPIVGGMISQNVLNIVDTAMVGSLGDKALAAVGMSGSEARVPHHLSLGQRKRIAVATVLSMDPSVLAFDEPTAGLDAPGYELLDALVGAVTAAQPGRLQTLPPNPGRDEAGLTMEIVIGI